MPTSTILLTTDGAPATLGDEGYSIHVMGKSVTITAPQGAGLFYGGETFRQLVPFTENNRAWTVPALSITDRPRFGERSLPSDCSRRRGLPREQAVTQQLAPVQQGGASGLI